MDRMVPLSVSELAALEALDGPSGHLIEPTQTTKRLIALGFIKATPLNFYFARAGRVRLKIERSRAKRKQRQANRSASVTSSKIER